MSHFFIVAGILTCDALAEQVNGQVVVVLDVDTIEVLHDNKPERSG